MVVEDSTWDQDEDERSSAVDNSVPVKEPAVEPGASVPVRRPAQTTGQRTCPMHISKASSTNIYCFLGSRAVIVATSHSAPSSETWVICSGPSTSPGPRSKEYASEPVSLIYQPRNFLVERRLSTTMSPGATSSR